MNVDTSVIGSNKVDLTWGSLIPGIHHGPVVTGFVGLNKNYFDIWGTTIDIVRSVSLMGQRGQVMVNRYLNLWARHVSEITLKIEILEIPQKVFRSNNNKRSRQTAHIC